MSKIQVKGGIPLTGVVKVSGSRNSSLKLIHAAMFSNEDVILDNVPRIGNIESDLQIIEQLGGRFERLGKNKLRMNGSGITSYEIPYELGKKYRSAALLAAPLVFRFGRAIIPLSDDYKMGNRPINRWLSTWESLGIKVSRDDKHIYLEGGNTEGGNISFKSNTVMGTENAILSAMICKNETIIKNAAEEPEIDDLINLCNMMGASVERIEPRVIKVVGTNIFKGASLKVRPDRIEAATFAVAALLTQGNVSIVNVDKSGMLALVNVLSKAGAKYEFSKNEMRVWHTGGIYSPVEVTTAPAPGFITDWQPLITLLMTQAHGESLIHETIYTDRFDYTQDLNRMGAKIELFRPSEVGIEMVISDDNYDLKKFGEPKTIAKVTGPSKLKGEKLIIPDLKAGATLFLAALAAENTSLISGYENIARGYESLADKFADLGAEVELVE
jgi:UDP-N-acetylglucosamine 1-carboxyvinyltransferase